MKKNVKIVPTRTVTFRLPDAPPLQGWAVRLLADVPEADFKKGWWMTTWQDKPRVSFSFVPDLEMTFQTEGDAKAVSDFVREKGGIETEVVKIGNP